MHILIKALILAINVHINGRRDKSVIHRGVKIDHLALVNAS